MSVFLTVKLEGHIGALIDETLTEATTIANRLGLCVEIEVNNVTMNIRPGNDAVRVIDRYLSAREEPFERFVAV